MAATIPQHDLRNGAGQPVSFHLQQWGGIDGYNTNHVHRHNFNEMLFFSEGGGVHDIDFTAHTILPGAIHFVASDNVHLLARNKNTHGCSLMFTAELFPAELLLRLPFNASIPVLHPDADTWSKATAMLQIITDEIKEERADFEQVVRMQMQALLVLLCRHCSNRPAEGKQYTAHVSGFLGLIKVHYKAHLTVEQYAALLHITAKHLIELCRKQTGKTPLQLIRQLVTTEAKRLLFHTGVSVKEVAYELNFEDPATFSKYFKSVCGYSPADFRAGK